MPRRARASAGSGRSPSFLNVIVPESLRTRPMTHLSSVVLPVPLRPIRQVREPSFTVRSISHRMWLPPYDWFNRDTVSIRTLSSEIHVDDVLVVLHLIHGAFGEHAAFVQHRHVAGDRSHELHVVLDHHHGVRAG